MHTFHFSRTVFRVIMPAAVFGVAISAALRADVSDSSVCIGRQLPSGAWVCAVGVENLRCGNSWHCKTLNVIPERQPKGGCVCSAYSTKAADGCMATGDWKAEGAVSHEPGVEFTLTAGETNRLLLIDYANIADNGDVEHYHAMRDPDDFIGTFSVTFGSGEPHAIPYHITDLNLQVNPFVFRGFNTGINTVVLGADAAEPAGEYNSLTNEFTATRQTHCIGYNNIFPGGYAISIRPFMKLARDGLWDVLPLADSDFSDCTGDFNADHTRDLIDLAVLLAQFGLAKGDPSFNPAADLDEDGVITLGDLTQLMIRFGRSCL